MPGPRQEKLGSNCDASLAQSETTDAVSLYLAGIKDLFNGELVGYAQRAGDTTPGYAFPYDIKGSTYIPQFAAAFTNKQNPAAERLLLEIKYPLWLALVVETQAFTDSLA
jgi:hypothetical protein